MHLLPHYSLSSFFEMGPPMLAFVHTMLRVLCSITPESNDSTHYAGEQHRCDGRKNFINRAEADFASRYADGDREDLEWDEIFSGKPDIRAIHLPAAVKDQLDAFTEPAGADLDTAFKPCELRRPTYLISILGDVLRHPLDVPCSPCAKLCSTCRPRQLDDPQCSSLGQAAACAERRQCPGSAEWCC